ncbi:MAG: helix-turn-helix domain-containing protein [Bacteroidales bacterium]
MLVEKYEREHHQMDAPDPIETIKFRMEHMNLKQQDVAPLFGGKTRVSEVLNGKRRLTLKMITLLNRYLGIPLESLISGNKEIRFKEGQKEKLLKISSIQDYLNGSRVAMMQKFLIVYALNKAIPGSRLRPQKKRPYLPVQPQRIKPISWWCYLYFTSLPRSPRR